MLSVIVGGDIVPSFKNKEKFETGKIESIADDSCLDLLKSVDFRVFNLETPLTNRSRPIAKEGANFAVPPEAANGLKALGINILGLANNHCKDQGADGLLDTINVLKENDIIPFGYGTNYNNCNSTVLLKKDDITIAFVACAETEYTIWENEEIGAIPYHDYYTNKFISEAKEKADAVVVLYHGGKEYFKYASPYLIDRCHLMVDCGADYVLCQHSHCISCCEKYKDGTILYGQGNFIFHQKNNLPETKTGLLAKIIVDKNKKTINFFQVRLDENDKVFLEEENDEDFKKFNQRNDEIKNIEKTEKKYRAFAQQKKDAYFSRMQGSNKILRLIRKILRKLGVEIYSKKDKLAILNFLQNEAHRELCIQALKDDIKNEEE